MRYAVVYEKGPTSWGAHAPDVPGVAAVGSTRSEVGERLREALTSHLQLLRDSGDPIPAPAIVETEFIEVA